MRLAGGLALLVALVAAPAPARAQQALTQPEGGTGRIEKPLATAKRHMVVAANPLAAEAGRAILRKGGTAADAAIAVQLVLGLVEPQSSGLGGGALVLHWDARARGLATYDGRETAPAAARPDRFLKAGRPRPFGEIVPSGLSIGAPGVARLLETLHARHGRLPWAELFQPAIALARSGFPVSDRLHRLLGAMGAARFEPTARAHFFTVNGSPWPVGHLLSNPAYAATLERIAAGGAGAFYEGPIAEAIVMAAAAAPGAAGDLTLADLAQYRVREREPVCVDYHRRRVCGMGPPSSGGISVAQTLLLLEPLELGRGPGAAMGPRAMHLIAEALKLAFADRDRYVADPDFVPVPAGLLDADYLAARRKLIDPARAAASRPEPGLPPGVGSRAYGVDATAESVGTSHLSIVDAEGNAVAMTTTIEAAFGARVMAAGMLLNNQLTDFSLVPADRTGRAIANRVEPGKRPRSSMAPTIVLDEAGQLSAVIGSPGGSRIIAYVVKALVAMIDWDLDPQVAAGLSNFGSRGGPFELELDGYSVWHALKVKPFGHTVRFEPMTSGLHILARRNGRLEGGADPRREGVALGD